MPSQGPLSLSSALPATHIPTRPCTSNQGPFEQPGGSHPFPDLQSPLLGVPLSALHGSRGSALDGLTLPTPQTHQTGSAGPADTAGAADSFQKPLGRCPVPVRSTEGATSVRAQLLRSPLHWGPLASPLLARTPMHLGGFVESLPLDLGERRHPHGER